MKSGNIQQHQKLVIWDTVKGLLCPNDKISILTGFIWGISKLDFCVNSNAIVQNGILLVMFTLSLVTPCI